MVDRKKKFPAITNIKKKNKKKFISIESFFFKIKNVGIKGSAREK